SSPRQEPRKVSKKTSASPDLTVLLRSPAPANWSLLAQFDRSARHRLRPPTTFHHPQAGDPLAQTTRFRDSYSIHCPPTGKATGSDRRPAPRTKKRVVPLPPPERHPPRPHPVQSCRTRP